MNDISTVELIEGGNAAAHAHGDFEVLCFESDGRLDADGQAFDCVHGDAVVLPPLIPRRLLSGSAVRVVLDKALLPLKSAIKLPADDARDLCDAATRALNYGAADGRRREGVLSAYGGLIAAMITAYTVPNGFSPAVKAVIEDAEKHVSDPTYSLESFIRTLPLNYDYVRKLFKKEVGATPHEYLTRARMERAKSIILSGMTNRYSDFTVTQIAEACGFSEPLYFSRVFKKYFGVAPSLYLNGAAQ
ncbi:MAG: helix-turn-helix transcriptional regulator [Clostridia bacterium]|nr:helix-turn-helix transcriptional regulator [Clostridia bacterium]